MVKIIVRYTDQSTQIFYGDNKEQADRRKKEYEKKHPTLLVEWQYYE